MTAVSDRYRKLAADLTRRVEAVPADRWDSPSPCEGWTARDVVRHLCDWLPGPGFLLGTWGIDTGPMPSVDDDPGGAWRAVRDAVQRGLDDPTIASKVEDCGPPGALSFEAAVDMTCTPDVLVHTWDLARAAGLAEHEALDADEVARQVAGIDAMPPAMDEAMRASGHFGARVDLAAGAPPLARLLAFYGRRA